jgi:nicotinamidase-related amidase
MADENGAQNMLSRRDLLKTGAAFGVAGGTLKSSTSDRRIELGFRTRDRDGRIHEATERVDPKRIAVIAVDVWHYHWCRTWRSRAGSLIPRFNQSFDAARRLGITMVFSPTEAMRDLNESPQRKATLALSQCPLPQPKNLPDPYTDNLRYGKCECGAGDECYRCYNSNNQHPDLRMAESDFIAITEQEAFNVLRGRGITHIIYTGFATNVCLWSKPIGLKYTRQLGFRCMVARDLTESETGYIEESFNPTRGTLEVIAQIERDLAPSLDLEQTLRRAGAWADDPVLDFVHIAPWGRYFGGVGFDVPVQAELTCRHVAGADLRYTLDGNDPTPTSPRYQHPIQIDNTVTLKAAGFKGEKPVTRISEAHYWKYPSVPDPPEVFVSDLDLVHEVIGEIRPHSYAVQKKARSNRSVDGHALSNRDGKYVKGIGVQSPAELVFEIKPAYKRFVALAGVDDECMRWDFPDGLEQWPQWSRPIHGPTSYRVSQIVFEVRIDGHRVAETPPMFNGDRAWGIDVEIPAGSHEITLVVRDVDSRITDPHGHGDWLNAGFVIG